MTIVFEDKQMRPESRHEERHGISRQERYIVERLARETETPEHEARQTYEREREKLDRGAKVKAFVSVIAARRARDSLRKKGR